MRSHHMVKARTVHHIRTSTYKQESSGHGWHEERGAPQKPLGGYWLTLDTKIRPTQETPLELDPVFVMAT